MYKNQMNLFGGADTPAQVEMFMVDAGDPGVILECTVCGNQTDWIESYNWEDANDKAYCHNCKSPGFLQD